MKRVLFSFVILCLFLPVLGQKAGSKIPSDSEIIKEKWLNKKAAEFVVEKWLTKEPATKGKFVFIDFWGTSCGPCRALIPELNEWQKRFKKDLVIIGVATNTEEEVRKMKEPVIEYSSAVDKQRRMAKMYGLKWYPMAVLIDPEGIIRWIGYPSSEKLSAETVEQIIKQYKK